MNAKDYLNALYAKSLNLIGNNDSIQTTLSSSETNDLDVILSRSESSKAVLTVLITSLVYKHLNPTQDIRNHQDAIPNGYSGRTFDTKYITPFLKEQRFPAMAESGWLTRSLEQRQPYTLSYSGSITPVSIKQPFLKLLDNVQNGASSEIYLEYLFQGLILQRNKHQIDLAKPISLSITEILNLVESHFNSEYTAEGASRLPTLAIYAIYQCVVSEIKRFNGKKLLLLESHTSADIRSGRIGDIDIIDENNRAFEAAEIKYKIPVSLKLVKDATAKFATTPVKRYYILSTSPYPQNEEMIQIQNEIQKISRIHGCQVIVNGVIPTIKYYLRLLNDPFEFVNNYVDLLENDTALKFEHKKKWNDIVGTGS